MDEIAVLRMLERIIAVGIAGMTIYLGYRLFFHLPFKNNDKGELIFPGIKIMLSQVGPGIFFVAFGSSVLIYSLTQPVTIKATQLSYQPSEPQSKILATTVSEEFSGLGQSLVTSNNQASDISNNKVSLQQRSRALQAVEILNCLQHLASKHPDLIAQSIPALREAKRTLLLSVWDDIDWGERQQLLPTGLANSANETLKIIYGINYRDCPQ